MSDDSAMMGLQPLWDLFFLLDLTHPPLFIGLQAQPSGMRGTLSGGFEKRATWSSPLPPIIVMLRRFGAILR